MFRIMGAGLAVALCAGAASQATDEAPLRAVSFAKQVMPVLKANCISCHDAKNHKGGVDMTDYKTLVMGENAGVVKPGDPDNSTLVQAISGDKPNMPKKGTPLPKNTVKLILTWVKEGAKNN